MQSIFNSENNAAIIRRLNALTNDAKPLWGKMSVDQMLVHCQVGLRSAFGEIQMKKTWMGFLFGRIAKKMVLAEKPFRKNSPTAPHFIITTHHQFEEERAKLIAMVERFAREGEACLGTKPHVFFGALTPAEWDLLMWKHLDHHLQQFGA